MMCALFQANRDDQMEKPDTRDLTGALKHEFAHYGSVFIGLGVAALVAYGFSAFNLIVAGDDWFVLHEPSHEVDKFLSLGRWMAVLLWSLFFGGRFAPSVTVALLVTALIISAYASARILGIENRFHLFLFCAIWVFNPILAEQVNFKMNHVPLAVGFLATVLAFFLAKRVAVSEGKTNIGQVRHIFLASRITGLTPGQQPRFLLVGARR